LQRSATRPPENETPCQEWPKLPGTAEAEEHHDTQNTSAPDELAEEQKDAERSQQRHIAADTTTECFSAA
jgi:hypothetical protein